VLPIVMRDRNGWTTLIFVQNRGSEPATVTATFRDEVGATAGTYTLSLATNGSDVIDPGAVAALPNGYVGSATLASSQPIAASVRETQTEGDSLDYSAAASGRDRAFAPLLFKRYNGWDSGLQVQNLGNEAVPATVTYRQTNGDGGPWLEEGLVPPSAALTFYQPANAELPSDFVGSATVEAPTGAQIVSVINAVHDLGSGVSYSAALEGSSVANAPLLLKSYNGWSTGLQIQNIGLVQSEVLIAYRANDGSGPWFDQAVVPAGSSVTFFQPAQPELPDGFVGSAIIVSQNDQPLVVIVNEVHATLHAAMSYRASNEGAATLSVPSLSRRADGWSSGVQVQNLRTDTTSVVLQILWPDGSLVTAASELLQPDGSHTFYLPALDAVPDGWRGAGVTTSSPPQPLGAVVNEIHY
jgi:hypothetical protein